MADPKETGIIRSPDTTQGNPDSLTPPDEPETGIIRNTGGHSEMIPPSGTHASAPIREKKGPVWKEIMRLVGGWLYLFTSPEPDIESPAPEIDIPGIGMSDLSEEDPQRLVNHISETV